MARFSNKGGVEGSPAQRTAAEREAARLEREQRRAARAGEPQSSAHTAEHEPVNVERQPPASVEERDPPHAEHQPLITDPTDPPEPVAESPAQHQPEPMPEAPERVREDLAAANPGARERLLARRAARVREQRARHRTLKLSGARAVALTALAVVAVVVWFAVSLFQPFHGAGHGRVIVEIPKGSSSSRIGSILAGAGVVKSGFFFDVRALVEGKRGSLHSGRFALRRDMSYGAAITALSRPAPRVIPVKVVIPEGMTRKQIAGLAGEDGLKGGYLTATERSRLLNPRDYGAPRSTPNLEGFLFPATYEMAAGSSVSRLIAEQLQAFEEHFGDGLAHRAHRLNVTPYGLLIVASMVEREAQLPGDRPKVAAVIYNRLRAHMALGIDATIRYALNDYDHPLTESQLKSSSPYNTRLHTGLPPTPISNPGAASLYAAAHPSHASYLYYVAGADGCGEQVFSTSYSEFERNAAAYRQALQENGGRVPRCTRHR